MQDISQVTEFGKVFLFLIMGVVFLGAAFFAGRVISLNKPNPEKNMSYECGEEPTGNSWLQFNSRFYVIALIFLLFDVELAFIFPWATIFGQQELLNADHRWGWLTLTEMLVFVGILVLGLAYAWMKGDLEWVKPSPIVPSANSSVPVSAYTAINNEVYKVRSFNSGTEPVQTDQEITEPVAATPKPAFRPVFRKPLS